jgi:hypothetical protein
MTIEPVPLSGGFAADGTKELIERCVARLVSRFSDEPFALFQGDTYTWGYVGHIKRFLDEVLEGVDPAVPAALVLRQRPNCLAATIALWGNGRCVTLVSPIRPDQAIAEEISALGSAIVVADTEDWARPGFAGACGDAIGVELRATPSMPVRPITRHLSRRAGPRVRRSASRWPGTICDGTSCANLPATAA